MVRPLRFLLLALAASAAAALSAAEPAEIAAMRSKAEQGNALAQYNLGLAYSTGQQVTANHAEAFAWLSLAAENGTTGKALDDLLANLSDRELAEGRQRYAQYRAAIAARASQTAATREAARRPGPRGFSLAPVTPARAEAAPGPAVTHPPEEVGPPAPPAPTAPDLLQAENTRLRAELARAQAQIRDQAATIERLTAGGKGAGAKPTP